MEGYVHKFLFNKINIGQLYRAIELCINFITSYVSESYAIFSQKTNHVLS